MVFEEQKPRAQFRFSTVINSRWMQELGGVCVKPDGRVRQFREITASVAALRGKVCAAVGVDPPDPGVGPAEGWGAVLKKLERKNTEITKLPPPYVTGGKEPTELAVISNIDCARGN